MGNITPEVEDILDSRVGVNISNEFGIKPTRLYSVNIDVDRINDKELDKLALKGAEFFEYEMDMNISPKVSNRAAAIEKFKKSCIAPHCLQLCIGAQVMLLKNLDLGSGLANGSRGIVSDFVQDLPIVKFLNGEERIIDMNIWEVQENDKPILTAKQIPLKIAFAYSIHKSQGTTLDLAEIDLSHIFEYGQAYVALSRVKSLDGLYLSSFVVERIQINTKVQEYYDSLKNDRKDENKGQQKEIPVAVAVAVPLTSRDNIFQQYQYVDSAFVEVMEGN
jgi:ATP-dependent DNA helicase PIF1